MTKGLSFKIHLKKNDIHKAVVGYRTGDIFIPTLDATEALWAEINHFADCITSGVTPQSSGAEGARIVAILEAASESLRQQGKPIEIKTLNDSIS